MTSLPDALTVSPHAPQQARAQRTLERLLDAAESLLEERPLDAITVRELATRAGVTTGAFYGRFEDKDACLASTFERFLRAGAGAARYVATPTEDRTVDVRQSLEQIVRATVRTYRVHGGLLRALDRYVAARPTSLAARLARDATTESTRRLAALLLVRRAGITHPDPDRAVHFALGLLFHALRDGVLRDSATAWASWSDRELAAELTSATLRYLGLDDPPTNR